MKKHLIYLAIITIACLLLVAVQRTRAEAPTETPLTIQEYAEMRVLTEFGEGQWESFNRIVMKESRWDNLAQNPTSTAFGIFQFLNGTWQMTGYTKTSDPYLQVEAGIIYIQKRYKLPSVALSFHNIHNYY